MSEVLDNQQSDWQRLDPKRILAATVAIFAAMLPVVAVMVISGAGAMRVFGVAGIWLAAGAAAAISSWAGWYFTRFRVTAERFEQRAGYLSRTYRSIPRERIRSVDLTAPPLHRLLGISVVRIGTGAQSGNEELKLDALATPAAEYLRAELMRPTPSPDEHASGITTTNADERSETLARMRPSWFGYSALTASFVLLTWSALGSVAGTLGDLARAFGFAESSASFVLHTPIWILALGSVSLLVFTGALGSLALSLEAWWAFRLTRETGPVLRVRRGLLTTRAMSLEQRRLRGAELAEPWLLRMARGARLNAIATGLGPAKGGKPTDSTSLMPPAPYGAVESTAGLVLRKPWPAPEPRSLPGHPKAALRRRLTWSLSPVLVLATALIVTARWVPWLPWWSGALVLLALPVTTGFAVDAYRNLGHDVREEHLVVTSGTGVRRTVVLQRSGIIGWKLRRSPMQRAAGLVTLTATTAAGNRGYPIRDVSPEQAFELAERAVPDLLAPFLERTGNADTEAESAVWNSSAKR